MNDEHSLLECAKTGFARAYAPYSKFNVGAAILADDGKIYGGGNVENASYPEGNCAEASAIAAMIFGGGKKIQKIMVYAEAATPIMPCGGCRQRISEFLETDGEILIASPSGVDLRLVLDDILPRRFGQDDLNQSSLQKLFESS